MSEVSEAAAHLRALMDSMYSGRSVRTPEEFRADLKALRVACEFMEQFDAQDRQQKESQTKVSGG